MAREEPGSTREDLRRRIGKLEAENKRLRSEISRLKSEKEGFYTLGDQFACSLDLGEFTRKLPPFIPEHQRWAASDYPKEWSPREKASEYLVAFWGNHPVSQSYFSNVRGGQSFYKYLKRNGLLDLLPNSFQLELKRRLRQP